MKAIRIHSFGPPEVMKLEEVPELVPGPGQVVVAVEAAGVNPVDTYIRSGLYRPDLKLPYTPGIDAAGVIVAISRPARRVVSVSSVLATPKRWPSRSSCK